MAKRQNFIVGSTNPITVVKTAEQLNTAWNKYEVLKSGDLDGVFNAVSDYSNDSSNEIANAIQSLTGSQPTGATQTELAGALTKMREDIETSSLTFKGYIATSAPSSSTYGLVEGNLWINSATLPTSFPIPAASIKEWNGTSWVNYGSTYTVADFDFFRNINDNEGYYWFGGQWTVMSTDMSTDYFTLNQTSGKWEIKTSVNLPGAPTAATPAASDDSTKLATTAWVRNYAEAAGSYANPDLSNLSSTGQNISNWSTNVSNCIIEIPQDINLELSSGTLTLKTGSKVYVPNGTGVFDAVTIPSDKTFSTGSANNNLFVFYYPGDGTIKSFLPENVVAGSSYSISDGIWFDTTNNIIKRISDGNVAYSGLSFPICILKSTNGAISSINQVFNGFGYMGSAAFVLPGVKCLIPDGRNTDGTLNSILKTITSVRVSLQDTSTNSYENYPIVLEEVPDSLIPFDNYYYDEKDNYVKSSSSHIVSSNRKCIVGFQSWDKTSGKITYFVPKQVFHAVDSNESDFVVAFQRPTSENNYTWYRKYKSGWVEQGGSADLDNHPTVQTITMPVPMADTRYTISVGHWCSSIGTGGYTGIGWNNKTTTTFELSGAQAGTGPGNNWDWEVKGMAA